MQIRVPTLGERSNEVQCGTRGVIGAQQPLRVDLAGGRGEGLLIDAVAEVGGQREPVTGLVQLRPRFEVLPRHSTDLDHRHPGAVREHDRHLQDSLEAGPDGIGGVRGERLGAVPAHEHERLTPSGLAQVVHELIAFPGEHQRRHHRQLRGDLGQPRRVGPHGLLGRRQIWPGNHVVGGKVRHDSKGNSRPDDRRSPLGGLRCRCSLHRLTVGDDFLGARGVEVDVLLTGQLHEFVHDFVGHGAQDKTVVLHPLVA